MSDEKKFALELAKEITVTAMEQKMIPQAVEPQETAKNIADFFDTIFLAISGK